MNTARHTENIGKYCVVRTVNSGVHCGFVESESGQRVVLTKARRLWYWEGAFTLNAVAMNGVHPDSKLSVETDRITLLDGIEIGQMSAVAAANIQSAKAHTP